MEFGFEPVCDQVRAISTWSQSNLVADWFKAEFHYAIWSHTGLKLVADRSEAGRTPASLS